MDRKDLERLIKTISETEGKPPFSLAEKVCNVIYNYYFTEDVQKEYDIFIIGWKFGKGFYTPWDAMEDYLYYSFGLDIEDVLNDLIKNV